MKSGNPSVSTHAASLAALLGVLAIHPIEAQSQALMRDPGLAITPVVSWLSQPIALAFLGPNDMLVTEKASGQVKRVTNGVVSGVVRWPGL